MTPWTSSKFQFAPEHLLDFEQELIDRADVVFTGGSSLYEAKKDRHANVHCFPSSVDRAHFAKARAGLFDPADQEDLPRRGSASTESSTSASIPSCFDARRDAARLVVRDGRPGGQDQRGGPAPRTTSITSGGKTYAQLPSYLSGWDVALMPFAMNESTEFISPTKTPEYPRRRQSRWSRRRSGTSSATTATSKAFRSPRRRKIRRGCEKALELRATRRRMAGRGGSDAFGDELGHHPGAHGGPRRRVLGTRSPRSPRPLLVAAE